MAKTVTETCKEISSLDEKYEISSKPLVETIRSLFNRDKDLEENAPEDKTDCELRNYDIKRSVYDFDLFNAAFGELDLIEKFFVGFQIKILKADLEIGRTTHKELRKSLQVGLIDMNTERKFLREGLTRHLTAVAEACPKIKKKCARLTTGARRALDTLAMAITATLGVVESYSLMLEPFANGHTFDLPFVVAVLRKLDPTSYPAFVLWGLRRIDALVENAWHDSRIHSAIGVGDALVSMMMRAMILRRMSQFPTEEEIASKTLAEERPTLKALKEALSFDIAKTLGIAHDDGDDDDDVPQSSAASEGGSNEASSDDSTGVAPKTTIVDCHLVSCLLSTFTIVISSLFDTHPLLPRHRLLEGFDPSELGDVCLKYVSVAVHISLLARESVDEMLRIALRIYEAGEEDKDEYHRFVGLVSTSTLYIKKLKKLEPANRRYSDLYREVLERVTSVPDIVKSDIEQLMSQPGKEDNLDHRISQHLITGAFYLSCADWERILSSCENMTIYTTKVASLIKAYGFLIPAIQEYLEKRSRNKPLNPYQLYGLYDHAISAVHESPELLGELARLSRAYVRNKISLADLPKDQPLIPTTAEIDTFTDRIGEILNEFETKQGEAQQEDNPLSDIIPTVIDSLVSSSTATDTTENTTSQ